MPAHSQKKRTISTIQASTAEQLTPVLPEQQEFHTHLRELARSTIRLVLEAVMREELDALIGAAWGECSPKRKGYRNGSYTRDLVTSTGRNEDIKVPRDREGQFHTQTFERYSRYEPHIAEGLTQMFVAGNKEVLSLRACAEESEDGWACLLQDLRTRGATQIDLIVTDGHDGLLAAVRKLFAATPRQRCLVHKQRNVLNAIPRRERGDVHAELVGIWDQQTKQEAVTQYEVWLRTKSTC